MTLQQHMNEFDFLGLALLMAGAVCVLLGLNSGETNCALYLAYKNLVLTSIARVICRDNCPPFCGMRAFSCRRDQRDPDFPVTHHPPSPV
jgi:hypothetical protein